ncbi:hypothetical protein R5W23_000273, partial [Gemmata sp. JC673]
NYISLPGGAMNYLVPGGMTTSPYGPTPHMKPIPYGIGFVEGVTQKKVIWRRVPTGAWGPGAALTKRVKGDGTVSGRGYIGALNKSAIWGHPPLTLQLMGVEERLLPDASGLGYSWDIGYQFTEKAVPFGHLGFYYFDNTGPASGYYLTGRGPGYPSVPGGLADGNHLFPVREFKNLFVPGAVS